MGIWYASREDVKHALDMAETARNNGQVDRAIDSASRSVEGMLRRRFYPQLATRHFDWPNRSYARSWRLWLNRDEVISVDTLTAGGVAIPATDYFLEPSNTGPPFTHIEIDLASTSAFQSGPTHQRAIAITGLFGYTNEETQVGTLSGALGSAESSSANVGWSDPRIGIGDILRIDDERMIVTARTMVDSTQNLQANLDDQQNAVTVAVTDGTAFTTDQILLIDSERMLIVDIAGNNLTVKRAWDGSVLAAHTTGAGVFTLTGVRLTRGALGTTAANHADASEILRHEVPGLVRELTIAEAINTIQQEQAGYARTVGSGESEREAGGRGLADIRKEAKARYGRQARTGAV